MADKKKITGSLEVSGSIISVEEPLVVETKKILWADLVALRDAGELIPGQQYRITDYECTTVQVNTQSAGHQFDIIVTADDVDKLNENASACLHEGDAYFADSKLESWQLKYCLDNDTDRFAWSDSVNGKGVIYRMIDEFNNDVPYDFKNIQFKKASVWNHTFGNDLLGNSYGNKISVYISSNKETLNAITFGNNCYSNIFGDSCRYNTFGNNCYSNTFGDDCYDITFGNECYSNTFGNSCRYNTFGNYCSSNTFGAYCLSNTFGGSCHSNTFGAYCHSNTFGAYCNSNTFGNYCQYLKISNTSSTQKKYIHVENGTQGASSANQFDLYDSAILNKNYQVTFKKDADGKYLMLWANNDGTMAGKVKATNTTETWSDIEKSDYIEVDITNLLVSTEEYTLTSSNLKTWKQGRIYGVCGIISLSLAGGKSLPNGTALTTAIPEAYRPNGNIVEHTQITYNGLRSFQLQTDGVITVYPTAIAGGVATILIHIDFVYNK